MHLSNAQSARVIYPARGLIYDRNGEIMVYNQAAYDIMVTPRLLEPFDTTQLMPDLGISRESVAERLRGASSYSYRVPSVFMKQVSYENAALLQEKLLPVSGILCPDQDPEKIYQAHMLLMHWDMWVKWISRFLIMNLTISWEITLGYRVLKKHMSLICAGQKGKNVFLKDVHNQTIESFQGGRLDVPVEVGKNLTSTLDASLQEYGEKLMTPYVGSIVALEPATGEVLALVSAPTYPPDLLVGRNLGNSLENWPQTRSILCLTGP